MTLIAVDTSVILAIVEAEAEAEAGLSEVILAASSTSFVMSMATRVELEIAVKNRIGAEGPELADGILDCYAVELVPLDESQMRHALTGAARYRRGANPMILNMGDLFSCGLAKAWDLPLLFKGHDFGRTDVRVAMDEPAIRALTET